MTFSIKSALYFIYITGHFAMLVCIYNISFCSFRNRSSCVFSAYIKSVQKHYLKYFDITEKIIHTLCPMFCFTFISRSVSFWFCTLNRICNELFLLLTILKTPITVKQFLLLIFCYPTAAILSATFTCSRNDQADGCFLFSLL